MKRGTGWYVAIGLSVAAFLMFPPYRELAGIVTVLLVASLITASNNAMHGGPPIWYCNDEEQAVEEGTPHDNACVQKKHNIMWLGKNYAEARQGVRTAAQRASMDK